VTDRLILKANKWLDNDNLHAYSYSLISSSSAPTNRYIYLFFN